MKLKLLQIALFFLLAALCSRVSSTPYHWDCGTFTIDATDTLIVCPPITTEYIYFTITNMGAADIYVRQIINSVNLPSGWSFNMCNPNACWGPNILVDTFLVPASSFVTARFDFHTDTAIGNGMTSVRFDDSATPLTNGATFNLHAVSQATGIDEALNENNSLLLYPNPVSDELRIQNAELRIEIEIYNAFGEMVNFHRQTTNNKQQTLDISQLPSGIYFVKVRGESQERMGKFVKQ